MRGQAEHLAGGREPLQQQVIALLVAAATGREQTISEPPALSVTQDTSSRRASASASGRVPPGRQVTRTIHSDWPRWRGLTIADHPQQPVGAQPPVAPGDGLLGHAEDVGDRAEAGPRVDLEAPG